MCKKEIDLVGCIPSVQHPMYNYISTRNIIIYAGTHNFRRIHSGSIMILHTLHTTLFELHAQNQKSVWRLPWTQYGIRILSIHLEVRLKVAGLQLETTKLCLVFHQMGNVYCATQHYYYGISLLHSSFPIVMPCIYSSLG